MLRRRPKTATALAPAEPAVTDGWDVPARFNFTRDVIEPLARQHSRSALTFVDKDGIVDRRTFREIAGDAARWAHLLRTRLDRGDRVLLAMGKVPAWHGAMLGALKGGLIAVPCPETLTAAELAFRVRHSGARLVIADRSCEVEVEEMREQVEASIAIMYLDEARLELSGYMGNAPTEDTTSAERALLLYTSGTAEEPRGVVHTHAFTWTMQGQAEHWLDVREDDVVWCTAGTGWAKSIWSALLGPWSHGAEVVLHQGAFDPEERLELVEKLGVTVLCQTPTEYRMLTRLDALHHARLARLRHAVSSGEPLDPETIARFQDAVGVTLYDGYGQTENALLVANVPQVELRPGSMGVPTPGHEVAVIDQHGQVCEPGVEGDIALSGRPPTLFAGYWEEREKTDAAFRGDWYVTGDRAVSDEDGYLWFVGRAEDVIVSASYRVGPFEVESALLQHPAVAEGAVVGAPDQERGEIVKAFVVLAPGNDPTPDLVTELQEHVKTSTAPYKYPREIAFVDELPKTINGKIRRSELRRQPETGYPEPRSLVIPLPVDENDRARAEDEAAAEARQEAREAARRAAAAAGLRAAERAALRDAEEANRLREEAARETAVETARREAMEAAQREVDAAASGAQDDSARDAEAAALALHEAARREAEAARREADAARAAEEAARREAELALQRAAEEAALREAEATARAAEEAARREAEAAAQRAAEEAARLEAEAAARREAEDAARREAEAAALREAEAARREAEEARREAEAARAAEEAARLEAEAAARRAAEEAALREAEEQARREAEAAAQRAAEDAARREAELAAQRHAEEQAREAEAAARREAEEQARREAAEAAQREAEEAARLEAEAAAQREAEAEAAAQREVEEAARREAEEAARLEAEAAAQREAEELARREAEAAARLEAEAAAQREAEAAAQREAQELARREAEEAARLEAEAAAQREAEEAAAKREAEELAQREAEEAARRAAEADAAAAAEAEQSMGRRDRKAAEKRRKEEERQRAREEAEQRKRDEADARERAQAEAEQRKRDEAEAKERAKAEAEQRKRDEADARERAKAEAEQRKRDEAEAKERAKAEAEQRKRDEAEAKERAKAEAEQRKRDEALARAAQKEEEKERRRIEREQAKLAKRRGRGLGGLLSRDDVGEDDYGDGDDDTPVVPIENIVQRLAPYARPRTPATPVPGGSVEEEQQPDAVRDASD